MTKENTRTPEELFALAPGSDEAIAAGCQCPVMDNHHGHGCGWRDEHGKPLFYMSELCPIHYNMALKKMEQNNG